MAQGADGGPGSGFGSDFPTSERVEREGADHVVHLRVDVLAGGLKMLSPGSSREAGDDLDSPDPEEAPPQVRAGQNPKP